MYKDIADYGLIGDMHSVALVSCDGSIDYCCMPHIDSPTVFAAILDDEKGGYFSIRPMGEFESKQEYVKDTNILRCDFRTKTGKAMLLDFMSASSQELFEKKEHVIHRCLRNISGRVDFEVAFYPRPRYATGIPNIEKKGSLFEVRLHKEVFTLVMKLGDACVEINQGSVIIHFSLEESEEAHFDLVYGEKRAGEVSSCDFEETQQFWLDWLHSCITGSCSFFGEFTDMISRSLLVLKLLTFQPTGAIAAAATTSLPESMGNERNWDYRFNWLRDASFTLRALLSAGHLSEVDSFIGWLHSLYRKYGSRDLQIMYSLEGETNLTEKVLKHLKGYRDSRPVRVGNEAYQQQQWDVYGEIMDTALRLSDYAGKIDENLWSFFREICSLAAENWHKPDSGIWEVRGSPQHYVYSKAMCWVALDRGIKIAQRYGFDAPLARWQKVADTIKEDILEKGYDRELKSFVQCYGTKDIDASLLLLPLQGMLPVSDEQIQNTINACEEKLMREYFIMRYLNPDGLSGEEGAFLLCNFWYVECLALSGRIKEAKEFLKKTVRAANHLGLFAEEYDYKENMVLGNFPQAFSHIGFINAVFTIRRAESKGSEEDRLPYFKRLSKLVPYKIVLNKSEMKYSDTTQEIGRQLKATLNNLQGAFFDGAEARVDYEAMKNSSSFSDYVELSEKLNHFDPLVLQTDEEKKAFWINIYNVLIIHGVIELEIYNSIREVNNFFRRIGYNIGQFYFCPDDIEHGILRCNRRLPGLFGRQFSIRDRRRGLIIQKFDVRIHFALVCAASSCPPIEFYDAKTIDSQLDIAGRSFLNRKGLLLDRKNNTLSLSQIFKWYTDDFGRNTRERLQFILKYAEPEIRDYVFANFRKMRIKYLPYDWNLNRSLK